VQGLIQLELENGLGWAPSPLYLLVSTWAVPHAARPGERTNQGTLPAAGNGTQQRTHGRSATNHFSSAAVFAQPLVTASFNVVQRRQCSQHTAGRER